MRNKANQTNIDNSNPADYPNGRIKNNTGGGDGTPVNEITKGDVHEFFDKLLRLYGISHNDLPDNETNGYQTIEALIAIASKNDYILDLSSSLDVLTIPLKLGKLKDNESIILKASIDKTVEVTIKGTLDGVAKPVTFLGDFKANEYVRMVNTAGTVVLIRMVDSFNLDSSTAALNFLKAASQAEEDAGAIDTKATTPLTNIIAFAKRIVGIDSDPYLVTTLHNGLMSLADKVKLDTLTNPEVNYGTIVGINPDAGVTGSNYVVTGSIAQAVLTQKTGGGNRITVTLNNELDNLSYEVKMHVESLGNILSDNDIFPPVFKKISTTQIEIFLQESSNTVQDITLHISTIQR